MQTFGQWLRNKRKDASLTQGQLARKSGISTSYVSTLERGQRHTVTNADPLPKPDIVEAIAKALTVPVDEARLAAGYAASEDNDPHGLASGLNRLSPERQAIAKKQIAAILDALAEEEQDTDYID